MTASNSTGEDEDKIQTEQVYRDIIKKLPQFKKGTLQGCDALLIIGISKKERALHVFSTGAIDAPAAMAIMRSLVSAFQMPMEVAMSTIMSAYFTHLPDKMQSQQTGVA